MTQSFTKTKARRTNMNVGVNLVNSTRTLFIIFRCSTKRMRDAGEGLPKADVTAARAVLCKQAPSEPEWGCKREGLKRPNAHNLCLGGFICVVVFATVTQLKVTQATDLGSIPDAAASHGCLLAPSTQWWDVSVSGQLQGCFCNSQFSSFYTNDNTDTRALGHLVDFQDSTRAQKNPGETVFDARRQPR